MPSGSQGRLDHPNIKQLGIVAGAGRLPELLIDHCLSHGITPFIVGLKGQVDTAILQGRDHVVVRPGAAGKIVDALKQRGITDLVMIGAVKRPSLLDLRPDFYAARFLADVSFNKLGDDGLLSAIRNELEEREGFAIHPLQDFIPDILMPAGLIGGPAPNTQTLKAIHIGIAASQTLGQADKGQSVLVKGKDIIGEEGPKGTNALIRDKGQPMAILVKTCKPQQDRALDLPTIGPETVQLCADKGMQGIALQAGAAFLVDREKVETLAKAHNLFVIGIDVEAPKDAG